MDPENSVGYVMMSNALVVDRQWGDVSGLRGSMREKRVRKQPGCSWISINGAVHEFLVGCLSHSQIGSVSYTRWIGEGNEDWMSIKYSDAKSGDADVTTMSHWRCFIFLVLYWLDLGSYF